MKVCDRCDAVVHDLDTYKKPDGTQFDLCLNCEIDHGDMKHENTVKWDEKRNKDYEKKLKAFMMEKPDHSDKEPQGEEEE